MRWKGYNERAAKRERSSGDRLSIRWSRSQWHHNVRRLVRSLARRFANLGPLRREERCEGHRITGDDAWRVGCHVPCTLTQLIHIVKTVLRIAPSYNKPDTSHFPDFLDRP